MSVRRADELAAEIRECLPIYGIRRAAALRALDSMLTNIRVLERLSRYAAVAYRRAREDERTLNELALRMVMQDRTGSLSAPER